VEEEAKAERGVEQTSHVVDGQRRDLLETAAAVVVVVVAATAAMTAAIDLVVLAAAAEAGNVGQNPPVRPSVTPQPPPGPHYHASQRCRITKKGTNGEESGLRRRNRN